MTNFIKLGTLVKFSTTSRFCLHDVQYDITEFYTKSQILDNKQLLKMKVLQFKSAARNMLYVDIVE